MKRLWSNDTKFQRWRRIWIELAKAEQKLGVPITDAQIAEMEQHSADVDYAMAASLEKKLRHDVVAHAHTFGHVAPTAKPIIHHGATSCLITDNTELMQLKEALELIQNRLARVLLQMREFAIRYRDLPTPGYTHLQHAQPVTVGKRTTMWMYDFMGDLRRLQTTSAELKFLGAKGTTGTQESFAKIFHGDMAKVTELDRLLTRACGFSQSVTVSGQTYSRKVDTEVIQVLGSFAGSAHKACGDIRLLQSFGELEEPFEEDQVGSSAMAYKRNPMRSERICALARLLMGHERTALDTQATQWLERTLDDSACRRVYLPESCLAADAICNLLYNIFGGLVVYPQIIRRRLESFLPFIATEEIISVMVEAGVDRHDCHEAIRKHSHAAAARMKEGEDNDLLSRIGHDGYFAPIHHRLAEFTDPGRFIGRAPQQVDELIEECDALLAPYQDKLVAAGEVTV